MPSKKPIKVDKSDYFRVLITETIPYETPIIFSNDGFYRQCLQYENEINPAKRLMFDRLVRAEGKKKSAYAIPFLYKIRKSGAEYRRLALLHPMSQWRMKEFYKKYERLITYFCAESEVSLRAPNRVAGTFFHKSSLANVNQYKRGGVQDLESDQYYKHSSSFFAYQGHDRLYKFFNSSDFLRLEKSFSLMWAMDVSKCFDSIYTHSIAWATKEKVFVKNNVSLGMRATFGNDFDELMQKSNYNETNGVVIGPEISRVFAEIIFQRIDTCVSEILLSESETIGTHYEIRRYVDDIYIFTSNESLAKRIYDVYTAELMKFNLHVNGAKTIRYDRPFFTKKSQVVGETNALINEFFSKFLHGGEEGGPVTPGDIVREDRLSRSFIDSVKSVCVANNVTYDDISSYVIGAFFERIKRLIDVVELSDETRPQYKSALAVIIEVMFFFYTAAPSVSASYKLCSSVILINRFAESHLGTLKHITKQRIFELSLDLFRIGLFGAHHKVENFVHLESVNVLLALSELGDNYLLPPDVVSRIFFASEKLSYFDIVACLFYIQRHSIYEQLRRTLTDKIESKIGDPANVDLYAEYACLFLDALSCPHLDMDRKVKWVTNFCKTFGGVSPPTPSQIYEFVGRSTEDFWFINWNEIDLLNALERKELKRAY